MTLVTNQEVISIYNEIMETDSDSDEMIFVNYTQIEIIDGIDVNISIYYHEKGIENKRLFFEIHALDFYEIRTLREDEEEEEEVTEFVLFVKYVKLNNPENLSKEDIRNVLMEIEKQADTLLLDTRIGLFKNYRRAININHVADDTCCVCLSLTKITTSCNHHLCLGCFQKSYKQNINKSHTCPVCRAKNITLRNNSLLYNASL